MDGDDWDKWIDIACAADSLPTDIDESAWTIEPSGPPLTSQEIGDAIHRLSKWQSTKTFGDDILGLCKRCSAADYFLQPRLKFLHDSFVLAEFATIRSADQVRLSEPNERWPDGYIKLGGCTFNVEVTSTHGGRRLGEEYRKMEGAGFVVEEDPVEDWIARADSVPTYLDQAIRDKIDRNYSSPYWLVVYLNISEWGIRQREIEQVISQVLYRHSSQFENISVLWKGKLYSTH